MLPSTLQLNKSTLRGQMDLQLCASKLQSHVHIVIYTLESWYNHTDLS
jgi:hypothetical protein